jgi:hypothetical protein
MKFPKHGLAPSCAERIGCMVAVITVSGRVEESIQEDVYFSVLKAHRLSLLARPFVLDIELAGCRQLVARLDR